MVAAFIHTVAADGIIREGRGRAVADHASKAAARSSADRVFGVAVSTAPSNHGKKILLHRYPAGLRLRE